MCHLWTPNWCEDIFFFYFKEESTKSETINFPQLSHKNIPHISFLLRYHKKNLVRVLVKVRWTTDVIQSLLRCVLCCAQPCFTVDLSVLSVIKIREQFTCVDVKALIGKILVNVGFTFTGKLSINNAKVTAC